MNQEEFDKRMQEIDTELIKKGIPIEGRPFEALNILCPNASFSLSPLEQYSQQHEWSDTLNKVLKLLELRIAEIEK